MLFFEIPATYLWKNSYSRVVAYYHSDQSGSLVQKQALLKVLSVPYLSVVVKFIISMKAMPIGRFCQMFVAFLENLCCINKKKIYQSKVHIW